MKSKNRVKLNGAITAKQVRLVGADGEQIGIVSLAEALAKAQEAGLDLMEIAQDAQPPVCRIVDYGKHLYAASKKRSLASKKQKQIKVKEVKFRPGTEEGDYQVKLRNLMRFLENGDKAKVSLRFRGREMAHVRIAEQLFARLEVDLEPYGEIEQRAKLEGRQMIMVLAPKRKVASKKTSSNAE